MSDAHDQPGEALYRKLVAEGRIAKNVTAERRLRHPKDPDKAVCGPAEAFFIRVDRDRREGEEARS
jgi:hypothetical protein